MPRDKGPSGATGASGSGLARLSYEDPFETPAAERRDDRRLRGRLVAPVTIWTAHAADGSPAGLTVSSLLVAEGDPALVHGIVDPLSALHEAAGEQGGFLVHVLEAGDERLASLFAGAYPVDPFEEVGWRASPEGPLLEGDRTVVTCRFVESRPSGFQSLVQGEITSVHFPGRAAGTGTGTAVGAAGGAPLAWYRGRFRRLEPEG